MSKLWVSEDGSWGVNKVKTFDTANWQDEDWDQLDAECDSLKLKFAKYVTRKRDKQATKRKAKRDALVKGILDLSRAEADLETQAIIDGAMRKETHTLIFDSNGNKSCACGLPEVIDFEDPSTWGPFKP